jgi:hypothetical protein
MDLLENCELCYPFTLSEFPATIVIEGNLDPAKQYYFKVTDKFQNSFVTSLITPDGDGTVTINVTTAPSSFIGELPAAWFNKNAGKFLIEASQTKDIWTPETFTFWIASAPSEYECIVVEFFNDDSEKNTIL